MPDARNFASVSKLLASLLLSATRFKTLVSRHTCVKICFVASTPSPPPSIHHPPGVFAIVSIRSCAASLRNTDKTHAMRTSMKLMWALAALLLLSGSCVRSDIADVTDDEDEYEDIVRAHLIVRKSATPDQLVVQGRNVTISIDIYNSGAG